MHWYTLTLGRELKREVDIMTPSKRVELRKKLQATIILQYKV